MPTSYQAPKRGDQPKRTMSQSAGSNLAHAEPTVATLLASKGGAVFGIAPSETLKAAVEMLRDKHVGALLVMDGDGNLKGILSERDIVRKLAETPGQTLPQTVEENMTTKVEVCEPAETMVSVLKRMSQGRFRHMPVVENEEVKGMVTIGDVVNFRLTQLEHEALQMKQMIVG